MLLKCRPVAGADARVGSLLPGGPRYDDDKHEQIGNVVLFPYVLDFSLVSNTWSFWQGKGPSTRGCGVSWSFGINATAACVVDQEFINSFLVLLASFGCL